jgi:hypothetical protein
MPAGVAPVPRQAAGTGGPACGPMAPQLTPNSLGWHESLQVHALAQPPAEEQPGLTIPIPGHWVGSLLKHSAPEPLLAVQETRARAATQPWYEASLGSKLVHLDRGAASPSFVLPIPLVCEFVNPLPLHATQVRSPSHGMLTRTRTSLELGRPDRPTLPRRPSTMRR